MGIVDSGDYHLYIYPEDPLQNANPTAPKVCVGTDNGQIEQPSATADIPIPQLNKAFQTNGHIMPSFKHTLVGLGTIYYINYFTVRFTKNM